MYLLPFNLQIYHLYHLLYITYQSSICSTICQSSILSMYSSISYYSFIYLSITINYHLSIYIICLSLVCLMSISGQHYCYASPSNWHQLHGPSIKVALWLIVPTLQLPPLSIFFSQSITVVLQSKRDLTTASPSHSVFREKHLTFTWLQALYCLVLVTSLICSFLVPQLPFWPS